MISPKSIALLTLASVLLYLGFKPSVAHAITLGFGGEPKVGKGQFSSLPGVTTIDFDSGVSNNGLASYSASNGSPSIVSGSQFLLYTSPESDSSSYLLVSPSGNGTNTPAFTTISLANPSDYFGMYWGSPDPHNVISFYKSGNLIQSFTGSGVLGGSQYANFFAEPGQTFDEIRLVSTKPAFESDNHSYRFVNQASPAEIPEPSNLAVFLIATSAVLHYRYHLRMTNQEP
jgi:hypothetical protein